MLVALTDALTLIAALAVFVAQLAMLTYFRTVVKKQDAIMKKLISMEVRTDAEEESIIDIYKESKRR